MRYLTIGLLMVGGVAFAQTTTTITGTVKNLDGTVATSGQVVFTLQAPTSATISGIGRFTNLPVICSIQSDGTIHNALNTGACVITSNTSLSPSGTYYSVAIQSAFRTPGALFNMYAFLSTQDISTVVPVPPSAPAYAPAAGSALVPAATPIVKSNGSVLINATAADVAATLAAATGCNTAGLVYSPQSNTCIAAGGANPAGADTAIQTKNGTSLAGPGPTINNSDGTLTLINGRLANRSDIIDVIADCGLPTDGVTDSFAAFHTCKAAHPGKIFFFKKTQAEGTADFEFISGPPFETGDTGTLRGTGWSYNSANTPPYLPPFGTIIQCAAGLTCVHAGDHVTIEKVNIVGSEPAPHLNGPTDQAKMILPAGGLLTEYTDIPTAMSRNSSGLVTVTVPAPSAWRVDGIITVSGVTPSSFNGTFYVLSSDGTGTLTYQQTGLGVATATVQGLIAAGTTGPSSADGISVEGAAVIIQEVGVSNFGRDCIRINGSFNSDNWRVRDSWLSGCRAQGFLSDRGSDTSAGQSLSMLSYFNQLYGVADFSFLGNRHQNPQLSFNHTGAVQPSGTAKVNISTISRTSGVVTVTTATPHGISVGNAVVVEGTTGDPTFSTKSTPDTGALNAYVVNPSPALGSYTVGAKVYFTPATGNTIPNPTINVSGLGVKTITRYDGAPLDVNFGIFGPFFPVILTYNVDGTFHLTSFGQVSGFVLTVPDATHFTYNSPVFGQANSSDTHGTVRLAWQSEVFLGSAINGGCYFVGGKNGVGVNLLISNYCEGGQGLDNNNISSNINPTVLSIQGQSGDGTVGGFQGISATSNGMGLQGDPSLLMNFNNYKFRPEGSSTDILAIDSTLKTSTFNGKTFTQSLGVTPAADAAQEAYVTNAASTIFVACFNTVDNYVAFNSTTCSSPGTGVGFSAFTSSQSAEMRLTQGSANTTPNVAVIGGSGAGALGTFASGALTALWFNDSADFFLQNSPLGDFTSNTLGGGGSTIFHYDHTAANFKMGVPLVLSDITHTGCVTSTSGVVSVLSGTGCGGIADPGSNGLMKRTALNTTAAAAFGDVVAVWTSCTSGWLQWNGVCTSPTASTQRGVDAVRDVALDNTGATDNSSTLQTYINALTGVGTEIFFPCGTYKFTAGVHVTTSTSVSLRGAATTTFSGTSNSCVNFNIAGGVNGIWFDYSGPTTSNRGVHISHIQFTDTSASNIALSALRLTSNNYFYLEDLGFQNFQGQSYNTGTVAVTQGSATVTGTSTVWTTGMDQKGMLWINGYPQQIDSINTGTQVITLTEPYEGTTNATASYELDWGGMGFVCDGGTGNASNFCQYGTLINLKSWKTRIPFMFIGGATNATGTSRIKAYGGNTDCQRLANSIGAFFGGFSDTNHWDMTENSCTIGLAVERGHEHVITGNYEIAGGTFPPNTTCAGSPSQACTKGILVRGWTTSNTRMNTVTHAEIAGYGNGIEVGLNASSTILDANNYTGNTVDRVLPAAGNPGFDSTLVMEQGQFKLPYGTFVNSTVRSVTTTSDTIAAGDMGAMVRYSNASTITVTIPVASTTGFGAGAVFHVKNTGAGSVVLTPTTSQIDGVATVSLAQNQGLDFYSDGTNYFTQQGRGAATNAANTWTFKQTFQGGNWFQQAPNAQTGTSYTVLNTDEAKLLSFNNAAAVAVTLPQATTAGFTTGAVFHFVNIGAGTVTITPTTSTVNGVAGAFTLTTGQGCDIYSDGANYYKI